MKRRLPILLVLLTTSLARADIYIYTGPDGERMVSDRPITSPGYELLTQRDSIQDAGQILAKRSMTPGSRDEIMSHIRIASRRYNVRADLIEAVIHVESGFDPNAISRAGATGLMQLMDTTAAYYEVIERHDPRENIHAGTRYLARLLKEFDGDIRLALAAYNAGPGAVKQYRGVPPYPETRRYIEKVFAHLSGSSVRQAAD